MSQWIEFLNSDENTRSCTSITLKIKDSWFNDFEEDKQRSIIKKLVKLLEEEKVAFDINGYNKAPPSLRLWGGATVENQNMENLLPWIDWAYNTVKSNA